MHNERRILRNATVLSAAEGAGQLANLVLVASFARAYGTSVMGYYSVGMSVGAIAGLFASLGIEGLLIRDLSRGPASARDLLGVLLPAQLLLAPLAWGVACVASLALVGRGAATAVVVAACGYQVLLTLASLLFAPLQAKELMHVSASCNLAHRALTLALGLIAIWLGARAGTVALAFIVGALSLIAMAWTQTSRRLGRPRLRFSPAEALRLYRRAMPFFGLTAVSVMYARGTTIVLSALTAAQAVGLYAVADRLMIPLSLGPSMFNAAAYPALARLAHSSPQGAQALLTRCLRLLLVAAIPLATLAAIFASDIVRLCFGASYLVAGQALRVLVWALPVRGAQSLLGSQLAALDQQIGLARARFIGLCMLLVLLPALILGLGFIGAAWAVLCCDTAQLLLYWRRLRIARAAPTVGAAIWAPAAAAAATAAVSAMLADLDLAVRLVAAIVAMTAGMWGFGAVKRHDLRFLRVLMSGKEEAAPTA
jgi:O-antigen/teichoic acid export membrane protein